MRMRIYKNGESEGTGYSVNKVETTAKRFPGTYARGNQAYFECSRPGHSEKITVVVDQEAIWQLVEQLQAEYPQACYWKTLSQRRALRTKGGK